jgi:hypothetical protein
MGLPRALLAEGERGVRGKGYLHFGVVVVEQLARAMEEREHEIVPVAVIASPLEDGKGGPPEV